MEKKVAHIGIVGSGHEARSLALIMERLKAAHQGVEVITLDEAQNRAKELSKNDDFVIKVKPELLIKPVIIETTKQYGFHSTGLSKRAARRKAERKIKKAT